MNMQTRLIRFDEQTVPGTSPDDLNPALWRRFRTVLSPKDDREFLEKMKLAATADWTRFMATAVDRANRHQDRGRLAAFWEAVKGVVWSDVFEVMRKRPEMHKDLSRLRKQVLGGMMSVIAFFQQDIYDFRAIVEMGKQLIEEDLRAFQRDEAEFEKRMMRKRNEALLSDMIPF